MFPSTLNAIARLPLPEVGPVSEIQPSLELAVHEQLFAVDTVADPGPPCTGMST